MDTAAKKTSTIVQKTIAVSRIEKLGKRFVSAKDTVTRKLNGATSVVFQSFAAMAKAIRSRASARVKGAMNIVKKGEISLEMQISLKSAPPMTHFGKG